MSEYHHPLGPSKHPAWRQCACYDSKDEVGDAARRGTLQHKYLEELIKGLPPTQLPEEHEDHLNEQEIEAVLWAYDVIRSTSIGSKLSSEVPVSYYFAPMDFTPVYDGTADAISDGADLIVFDYKSGEDHNYTAQMAAYALAAMQQYNKQSCRTITLFGATRQMNDSTWQYNEALEYVTQTLSIRRNENRKPVACNYCRWCQHAATCPEMASRALAVNSGRADWQLEQYKADAITNPAEMAKALTLARFLKSWCSSVEHAAKDMAVKSGEVIPGYKLVTRAGNREVKITVTAVEDSGLSPEQFLRCCTTQVTKLEKMLGKRVFAEKMANHVKRKPDQTFLVSVTEKEEDSNEGEV